MTDEDKTRQSQIEAYARMHGFGRLTPEHLARMAELAPKVAQLGSGIPRPGRKADAPAERLALTKPWP